MSDLSTQEIKELLLLALDKYSILGQIVTWEELNVEYKKRMGY